MSEEKEGEARSQREGHGGDIGVVAGELAGAVAGSAAGPVGAMAGMVLGAIAGGLAGTVIEEQARRAAAHDTELDEAIGVVGGDIGAARDVAADFLVLSRARYSSRGPFDPERAVP